MTVCRRCKRSLSSGDTARFVKFDGKSELLCATDHNLLYAYCDSLGEKRLRVTSKARTHYVTFDRKTFVMTPARFLDAFTFCIK